MTVLVGTKTLSAISPNKSLLAVHNGSRDNDNYPEDGHRVLIKCYDSKLNPGTLKFTLSTTSVKIAQILFPQTTHNKSPKFLLARTSANSILIFDLTRGVLCQDIQLLTNGKLIHITGNEDYLFALIQNPKDGKVVVQVHEISSGKTVRRVKFGSCAIGQVGGVGVHDTHDFVAVKMDTRVKVMNWRTGEKLKQFKKTNIQTESPDASRVFIDFSNKEVMLISSGFEVTLVSVATGEKITSITFEEKIKTLDTHTCVSTNSVFLVVTTSSKAKLYEVATSKKAKSLNAFATLTPALGIEECESHAYFLSGSRGDTELAFATFSKNGLGDIMDVSVTMMEYKNPSGDLCNGELLKSDSRQKKEADSISSKKRKTKSIVLGPGEDGGEALRITDHIQKKTKVGEDVENHIDFNLERTEDREHTIAQRLALLSSELGRDTEDEDDHIRNEILFEANNAETNFNAKKATSDSLVTLLRQALESNDDSKLEVAFQVSDKKVVENSVIALAADMQENEGGSDLIVTLLSKLVTRLSRKPARAQGLSLWVRNVLVALVSAGDKDSGEWKLGKKERDVAAKLGPLRNMLNERVECLPLLIRLEGRLALLGKI